MNEIFFLRIRWRAPIRSLHEHAGAKPGLSLTLEQTFHTPGPNSATTRFEDTAKDDSKSHHNRTNPKNDNRQREALL
eukprot:123258-Hanusia_phi.AAC.6